MRVILMLARFVMLMFWTLAFSVIGHSVVRLAYVQPKIQAEQPNNPEAVKKAMVPYALPIVGGALVLAIALKALGVLPGAGRRKPSTTRPPEPTAATALPAGTVLLPQRRPDFVEAVIRQLTAPAEGWQDAQQEPPLPPELASLGRPLQIHAGTVSALSLVLLAIGVFFLLGAGVCVLVYLKAPFNKDAAIPPAIMLCLAASAASLGGLALCVAGWGQGDLGKGVKEAYLLYPDALVWLRNDSFDLVRWNDITVLLSPRNLGDYHIATRDGRTLPIKHAVKDYWNLIGSVFNRLVQEIIPPLQSAVAEGKTVTFGPFEVSRDAIGYKGKILAWANVAVLRVEIGQLGRRLRIRASGSLLPWCYCNLESFPNGVLLPELLRLVCPQRLLMPRQSTM